MKNRQLKKDIIIVLFLVELYIAITYFYEFNTLDKSFIFLSVLFVGCTLAYLFGHIFSLYSSLIFVAVYGTYLLILSFNNGFIYITQLIFIVIYPITVTTIGLYSTHEKSDSKKIAILEENMANYVTIDTMTGLENITAFNLDLKRAMSYSKRYKTNLFLAVIEIKYFEELKELYKVDELNQIIKQITHRLSQITRLEDNKYRLSNNQFGIILENIAQEGADKVKSKLKNEISEIKIKKVNDNTESIYIEFKIGLIMYADEIKNTQQFLGLAKKEIDYDV